MLKQHVKVKMQRSNVQMTVSSCLGTEQSENMAKKAAGEDGEVCAGGQALVLPESIVLHRCMQKSSCKQNLAEKLDMHPYN